MIKLRKEIIENEFKKLNSKQKEAVFKTQGPLLILAGAGSGKTTVLVNRISNIIKYGNAYNSDEFINDLSSSDIERFQECLDKGIDPDFDLASKLAVDPARSYEILAITFTNKAARELKNRLNKMLGEKSEGIWAFTFHSACMRILRVYAESLGYSKNFVVYDTLDSQKIVKQILEDFDVSENILNCKSALNIISKAKNNILSPKEYSEHCGDNFRTEIAAKVYQKYQAKLKQSDAMDFDDLLFNTVKLFQNCPEVLERYQNKFKYIVIDEYQDTNTIQYEFARLLAEKNRNLCVVGDDDQSIYKFRGATIENILDFEKSYPDAKTIRLEQNYRSTKSILDCANKLISNNSERKGKTLWTDNIQGEGVDVVTLESDYGETRFIADTINKGIKNGRKYSDFSVLYRMNVQSNLIERMFIKSGIPYRIVGGHRFYDRAEVRDMIAYMSVTVNPRDDARLLRIINLPRRGIGKTTVDVLVKVAQKAGKPVIDIVRNSEKYSACSKFSDNLSEFCDLLDKLIDVSKDDSISLVERYQKFLDITGYLNFVKASNKNKENRLNNIEELKTNLQIYEDTNPEDISIEGFLQEVSLLTDIDNFEGNSDCVTLMTMHSAKGLEFPVVFLPGFEESIFPSLQSTMSQKEIEEERRLAYVAITRAREKLYISTAKKRILLGKTMLNQESRFIVELPENCIERQTLAAQKDMISVLSMSRRAKKHSTMETQMNLENFMKPKLSDSKTERFNIGDKVNHKKFGHGNILSFSDMGSDVMLEIEFEEVGKKKLMANFANVERI